MGKGMQRSYLVLAIMFLALLGVAWFFGFSGKNKESNRANDAKEANGLLMRVGETVATVGDFATLFEIAKVAYPYEGQIESDVHQKLRLQVMNQLKVELLLRERARELNLAVSDQTLETEIAKIKGDFPDEEFEKTLLEQAVNFKIWAARLRIRLLMQKVIAHDLSDKIRLTPEAVKAHAQTYATAESQQKGPDGVKPEKIPPDEKQIAEDLRRQKTEDAYSQWIQMLEKKYPVHIDQFQWKRIYGSIPATTDIAIS